MQQEQQFNIIRVFVKDSSFEIPAAPEIFTKSLAPHIKLEVHTVESKLSEDIYEVTLKITATAEHKTEENEANKPAEVIYVVEVQQSGIFKINGIEGEQLQHILGAFIPNLLFPYARTTIDTLVVSGSFPALMLSPINFDALYQQKIAAETNNIKND